jgi:glycosyltransferase involved in cell wall biosynthesis
VIGISRFIVDRHRLLGYFRDTPYAVIHNSLDLGIQDESPRERSLPLRVGFFGRIEAQKGITALVQAAMAVGPGKLELIVGGTGDAKLIDDLKAASSGLSIRFLGRIAPNEFFPLVDVLVVPSLWHEPLGRVVLEAYAWGRPVIVSNRGGLPEIVREGETGFVFDPGIPGGLAMILQRCVASPGKLLRMAAECRAYARSFSSEAIGSAYLHAYQSLVSSALGLAQ